MDISKYINEHLDEIIDNPDSLLNNSINTLDFLKHNEQMEIEYWYMDYMFLEFA